MRIGFDNEKYQKIQSEHIKERISQFDGKLYLELGGKLFDDHHASRVLPGFLPDSKLRMFQKISDSIEIVIVISAADIEKNKNKQRESLLLCHRRCALRCRRYYTVGLPRRPSEQFLEFTLKGKGHQQRGIQPMPQLALHLLHQRYARRSYGQGF